MKTKSCKLGVHLYSFQDRSIAANISRVGQKKDPMKLQE